METYLVCAYFGINLYLTGRLYEIVEDRSILHRTAFHGLFIAFGIPALLVPMIYSGLKELASLFQIRFLFKLLVLGKFRDASVEQLQKNSMYLYPANTLRGRIQKLCLDLWIKRITPTTPCRTN